MNRIDLLFQQKNHKILSIYFTAGYPALNDTLKILQYLQENKVDMVEIGIPFSDPLADGPVIQQSSTVALKNGMSLKLLFEQLALLRETIHIPVILMGYFNTIYKFGFENFCKACQQVGVDGFILPDLPLDEYQDLYKSITTKYNLHHVLLITPQTSLERIKIIDTITGGFIYAVSTYATTGSSKNIDGSVHYFEKLKQLSLKHPIMIGFGIKDKLSFEIACQYAKGGIIGTAFIKAITETNNLKETIRNFIMQFN